MLKKSLKVSLLALGALVSFNALADAGFKVPVHYNVELVDGKSDFDYSRVSRTVNWTPGKHQIVVVFKDTFKNGSDSRLVQSLDPLVLNFENIKDDQVVTFQYRKPLSESQANTYIANQKITTFNDNNGRTLGKDEASYFILTSDQGFSMMRDYRNELKSLNRLYEPDYVAGPNRGLEMTKEGAPTIRASTGGVYDNQVTEQASVGLEPMGGDTSAMTTSTAGKSTKANAASYNELVRLYNQADDATKLKFVKYVMAH